MNVGILGMGRLGRTLSLMLDRVGHRVDLRGRGQVPEGDIVLLTVPDAALSDAARAIPLGRIVLHCSGAADVEPLRPHRPAGSFHPLMTFPGPETAIPDLHGVPAAVAGDPEAVEAAEIIASTLGMRAFRVPGDRRLYHAAAVMAGNFATVLLAEAAKVLVAAGVPARDAPGLLAPLALTSLHNAAALGPATALTGPVARRDETTIQRHRDALSEHRLDPTLSVYDTLTERARALLLEKS
jgi:predicted short-subunit dehydrogenase-like oxidoreductase (DUF2520 family)